ncbi:MAG: TonB family protein [Prolixibacteraceae bacterium]|nr:TonB family protein [Prolixibacteraceae bacterium]
MTGDYKIWHTNGQLNFSGNYKDNLKNGLFQTFNESGELIKEGQYENGKLISGEPIVQDLIYEIPDIPAQFIDGPKAFNDYLKLKSENLKDILSSNQKDLRIISLNITVNKQGIIENLNLLSQQSAEDQNLLNYIFEDFKGFKPGTVEGVPVTSVFPLDLLLSSEGNQFKLENSISQITEENDSLENDSTSIVDINPDFPGGQIALRRFIATNVRYPVEAQEKGIQGKVFVQYVIEPDGSISNVKIDKGVHPVIDAEAIRVVKLMPKWIPARQNGKPVRVSYTVPVNFVLQRG